MPRGSIHSWDVEFCSSEFLLPLQAGIPLLVSLAPAQCRAFGHAPRLRGSKNACLHSTLTPRVSSKAHVYFLFASYARLRLKKEEENRRQAPIRFNNILSEIGFSELN